MKIFEFANERLRYCTLKLNDNLFRNPFSRPPRNLKMHVPSFDLTPRASRRLRLVICKWKTVLRNLHKDSVLQNPRMLSMVRRGSFKTTYEAFPEFRITSNSQHGILKLIGQFTGIDIVPMQLVKTAVFEKSYHRSNIQT